MNVVMQLVGLLLAGFIGGLGFWWAAKFVGRGRMA